jgi:methyl-accepting chemotaxis protein WspA
MKNWIQNRSLLLSLLTGGVGVIVFLAALWLGTATFFLGQSDTANKVRVAAGDISNQFLELRRAEKDFMLRDLRKAEFFEKGTSENLARHAALMATMPAAVERLAGMVTGREQALTAQMPAVITAYGDSFRKLAAAYRQQGHKDWGVEGEWRKAIHNVEQHLRKANDLSLDVELLQLRRNEKDYLLRGENKYVDAVFAGLNQLSAKVESSRDRALAQQLKEDLKAYESSFKKYTAIEEKIGKTEDAGLQGELRKAAHKVEPLLLAISQQAALDAEAARQQLIIASLGAMVIGIGLAALFFYLFARVVSDPIMRLSEVAMSVGGGDLSARMNFESANELGILARGFNQMIEALSTLIGQVQKSGMQVSTSVTEVAATAKQQQATAGEVAATTSEIGATSKEIWATSKELVKTMDEVSSVAEQSALLAGNGQHGLSQMEETMRRVVDAAGSINTKLSVLNEKASNISQVVTTITKVADQTNLLSLNAAIEAEKAGEHGRGFSVVATEIRRLADQTAVATYDIEQMVKEIQSAVSAGVMGMDKFSEEVRRGMQEVQHVGGQLQEIIQQVQALAPRFESVNEGMQAQATGAEQISEALMQLSEATQQSVEALRQSNAAIEDLNLVASVLLGGVSRFKLQA